MLKDSRCWRNFFPGDTSQPCDGREEIPRLGLAKKEDDHVYDHESRIPKKFLNPRRSSDFVTLSPFVQTKALLTYKHAVYNMIKAPMNQEEERFIYEIWDNEMEYFEKPCTFSQFQEACRSLLKWEFENRGPDKYVPTVMEYGWRGLDLHDVPSGTDIHALFFGDINW